MKRRKKNDLKGRKKIQKNKKSASRQHNNEQYKDHSNIRQLLTKIPKYQENQIVKLSYYPRSNAHTTKTTIYI